MVFGNWNQTVLKYILAYQNILDSKLLLFGDSKGIYLSQQDQGLVSCVLLTFCFYPNETKVTNVLSFIVLSVAVCTSHLFVGGGNS